ncbi:MAG: hypothetical protein IKX20_02880 [Paludibacteraceae bacterium]|nr:hypothetical protein [Paludibacteraceae bacterium]
MDKKLNVIATIKDGVAIALVNYLSLVAAAALYVITLWIPYLNVGTTIAMCSLPAEMAKGNIVNPLFIFKGEYRRNMGEFFILMSLMYGAIGVGFMFMGIPGFVLSVAWSFAAVLFVDKGLNALEALRESNRLTYGNKWRIFGAEFLVALALCIAVGIVSALFGIGNHAWLETIGAIINLILIVFAVPAIYGVEASIYKQLTSGKFLAAPAAEAPVAEAPKAKPAPEAPKAPKAQAKKAAPKAKSSKAEKK